MNQEYFQNGIVQESPLLTVLAVDDDEDVHGILRPYLEQQRYAYFAARDGDGMMQSIVHQKPDVILLDVMLPGKDGLQLIADIRRVTKAPIILLSGSSSKNVKITGLEMGADDFMAKPVELRELTARIKAILRRSNTREAADHAGAKAIQLCFGGWTLDRQQYQLLDKQGKSAELTLGEFRLLEALIMASGSAVSREQLFELTRTGDADSGERAIDAQIARLRKKAQKAKAPKTFIQTIRNVGYMFSGRLEEKNA